MKSIHDPKYSNIKRLLQSENLEDVKIGLIILSTKFTREEILWNFPNMDTPDRNFASKSKKFIWTEIKEIYIAVDEHYIYAFRDSGDWDELFNEEKIKL